MVLSQITHARVHDADDLPEEIFLYGCLLQHMIYPLSHQLGERNAAPLRLGAQRLNLILAQGYVDRFHCRGQATP